MNETRDITGPLKRAIESLPYCTAHRLQSGRVKVRGAWMHLEREGTPDLLALLSTGDAPPLPVYFETKAPKKGATAVQLKVHAELRRTGALVFVVQSCQAGIAEVRRILQLATSAVASQAVETEVASAARGANESGRGVAGNSASTGVREILTGRFSNSCKV